MGNGKESNFEEDLKAEQVISEFLDENLYCDFDNFERVIDMDMQMKGIDCIFKIPGKETKAFVDEKAMITYVNVDLPTFAFELSYIKDDMIKEGWLRDPKKIATHYMLIWVDATEEKDFTKDDITRLRCLLIPRCKITQLIAEHMDMEEVNRIQKMLRESLQFPSIRNPTWPFKFVISRHLAEEPINIVIRKTKLLELIDGEFEVSSENVEKIHDKVSKQDSKAE